MPRGFAAVVCRAGIGLVGFGAMPAEAEETSLEEIAVTAVSRPGAPSGGAGAGDDRRVPVGVLPVVSDSFSSVTVVPGSELARSQPTSLGDALFDRPGLSASTFAPGSASRPIIRGLDNSRVRIQENGSGVQDVSDLGEDHAVPINPLVNDRIEVIRGPAGLRYGSQAIGGVVSAENNRIPTVLPSGGFGSRVTSGFSAVDNGRNVAATVDAGSGNVAVHADGFRSVADSYDTPLGIQRNSASKSQGGALGTSYIFDRGFVGLSFSHYDALYQIPGLASAARRTRLDPTQDKLQARGEYRPREGPFSAIRFWLGGAHYRHNEIGLGPGGADGIQATFKNREAEGRLELQHVPVETAFGTLSGTLGFQSDRRKLSISGAEGGLLRPSDTRANAAYLFEELSLEHGLRLQAAGRIEGNRVSGTEAVFPPGYLPDGPGDEPAEFGRRRRFAPKSASFGLLRDLPYDLVGSLTASYVERAPAAAELFSRGPHDAPGTFEIGDPDLKLERARTLELGLRRASGPFRLDATGYVTRYTGFIFKRLTGFTCGDTFDTCGLDGGPFRQVAYAQANTTFYGAEIASQLDLIPVGDGFAGLSAQYDFVRAQFDDGSFVPRIPPHRVGGGVFLRSGAWYAQVSLLHAFAQTRNAALETATPGYNDLKAEVAYTRALDPTVDGLSEVSLGLRGTNLLDDVIRNAASFKKDEVVLPGRNLRLFLTARF
ncbi:TonB-dependent receptor [Methylobacterium organophilum]|uniref:TonB-dependent receptor n=1 Tax=Methylobacterium organophilum TaxID=410 RepID=A0ABQ4T168_METOR|nr:TonB-dependent receptor [Methylobacterium organophilum]GJE25377.1 putative TonB-dependent receptor [Methylobacterium organophilum]